jgi:hypothetical protein
MTNRDETFALIKIFDVLTSGSLPEEDRLMIGAMHLEDLIAARHLDENPLSLNAKQLGIELAHKEICVTCQTSYSWQICNSLRKELEK